MPISPTMARAMRWPRAPSPRGSWLRGGDEDDAAAGGIDGGREMLGLPLGGGSLPDDSSPKVTLRRRRSIRRFSTDRGSEGRSPAAGSDPVEESTGADGSDGGAGG